MFNTWEDVRRVRDQLLQMSDGAFFVAAEAGVELDVVMKTYRNDLRDVPDIFSDPADVVMPDPWANPPVVSVSIVFQFWKKLFAVVMSPIVPALAIVPQDKSAPSFVRYFPDAPEVEGESFGSVTELLTILADVTVPSAGTIVVPTSLITTASTVSPSAKKSVAGDRVSVEPDVVYVLVA